MKILMFLGQIILALFLAPLLNGFIKKVKAFMQNRQGPPLWQPYLDLYKLWFKESLYSQESSFIMRLTPYVYAASVITASAFVPVFSKNTPLSFKGDLFLVIYLFALGRFFMALAGLDAGSSFGGMGSSREMALSSLAEPALLMSLLAVAIKAGSSDFSQIASTIWSSSNLTVVFLALISFFAILIAETGRIPIDNPDTHLELTMVHEGMLLEFTGRDLFLINLGFYLKQLILYSILINIFLPFFPGIWGFIIKLTLASFTVGFIESITNKMRLFRVPDYLSFAFFLALVAVGIQFIFRGV